jgi:hypothetical protein
LALLPSIVANINENARNQQQIPKLDNYFRLRSLGPGAQPLPACAPHGARHPERRSHDYVRHGTTSLLAALDTMAGTVITSLHKRHRAVEFRKFLERIDIEMLDDLDVHLVLDNYATHKTPAIKR